MRGDLTVGGTASGARAGTVVSTDGAAQLTVESIAGGNATLEAKAPVGQARSWSGRGW